MDASAGSGKTRNLVKHILGTILNNNDPLSGIRATLALTFTNKAAAEMKHRLLEYLIDFSANHSSESGLLAELSTELNLTEAEIKVRAKNALKKLLHNYNDLSFGTLDSFSSRLVRTFAKDMALSESFEIALDPKGLINDSIDLVLNKAGVDEELTKVLIGFVALKMADEKDPRLDGALRNLAAKWLTEKHRPHLAHIERFSAGEIVDIYHKINARSKAAIEELVRYGEDLEQFIKRFGIEPKDFSQGERGIAGYIKKCKNGDFVGAQKINFRTQYIEKGNWCAKTAPPSLKNVVDSIADDLRQKLLSIEDFALNNASAVLLDNRVTQNLYGMATLNALNQAMNEVMEAQNVVPLSTFNNLINSKLINEPSQYIYERLGERYQNYFLDEFQDTSILQWQNLHPLVANSLAGRGTALVVGDAKQSIYRWRNGEAEQFIGLSQRAETLNTFQFKGDAHHISLAENWRSLENIVAFNNDLFTYCASHFEDEQYEKLYSQAGQNARAGHGGYITISILDRTNYNIEAVALTLEKIAALLAGGYTYRDIALLVRTKDEGVELVEALTANNIPVISADSLLLRGAYESNILAGLTALRTMPNNLHMRWLWINSALSSGLITPKSSAFSFGKNLVHATAETVLGELEHFFGGIKSVFSAELDLVSFTRQLSLVLGFGGLNNPFVDGYLQAVENFVQQNHGTDFEFVAWWQEKGSQTAIGAPEQIDAVQVTTIHKSKGLQYPVVIMPFVKWKLNPKGREDWVKLDPNLYFGISEMILSLSAAEASIIGGDYEEANARSRAQELFDNINMLYVGCTRAERQLHIFASDKPKTDFIDFYLHKFLETQADFNQNGYAYERGTFQPPKIKGVVIDAVVAKPLKTQPWQGRLQLAKAAPADWHTAQPDARVWGNKVHWVLSQIAHQNQVETTLKKLHLAGVFSSQEIDYLKVIIQEVVRHPKIASAFSERATCYTERDLLLPDGTTKRPDRISILPNGAIILLDYKTGKPLPEHEQQLKEYANLLAEAGFAKPTVFLVYLDENIVAHEIAI